MSFEPFNWGVVILGAWNRAILVPAWIGRFIFELQEGTQLQVEVPLDVWGPWRVMHRGVAVVAQASGLEIAAQKCDYDTLDFARQCGARALEALPRTPLKAAGFNVRYRSQEPQPELVAATQCKLDASLPDVDFHIRATRIIRSLPHEGGQINLSIEMPGEEVLVSFNFHKGSTDCMVLKKWLQIPIAGVRQAVETLIGKLPGVGL